MPMRPLHAVLAAATLALAPAGVAPALRAQDAAPAENEDYSLAGLERFESAADLDAWFTGYRTHPEPGRVPAAIIAFSEFGRLNNNRALIILSAFFAEIVRHNPDQIAEWDAVLRDANEGERWLLWNAVWWADVEGAEAFFRARAESARERDRETLLYFAENDPVDLLTAELDNEIVLVALAYSYFGGGNPVYLERMAEPLGVLPPSIGEVSATGVPASERFAADASNLFINYAAMHDDILAFVEDKAIHGNEWMQRRMTRVLREARNEREARAAQQDTPDAPQGPAGPGGD